MRRLKAAAKRSKWLVIVATVAKDLRARMAARHGVPESTSGSTHETLATSESLGYIDRVFTDYCEYGRLDADALNGARVLELGPGDNFGVALRFLAGGASRVICVDKFASRRDESHQRRIYEALFERLDPARRQGLAGVLAPDGVRTPGDRLQIVEGVAGEELADAFEAESFNLIVSRAVLEHLYDTDAALDAMDAVLAPGGLMLHKVDFRDHGMFTDGGMHPLTFLTVPDGLYSLMTRNSGRPNRRLSDWYRAKLGELGYEFRLLVTHFVGEPGEVLPHRDQAGLAAEVNGGALGLVRAIRPRLAPRFESLSDSDLATDGIFIVARKPGGPAGNGAMPGSTEIAG